MTLYAVIGGTNDGRKIPPDGVIVDLPKLLSMPPINLIDNGADSVEIKTDRYTFRKIHSPESDIGYYALESLSDLGALIMALDTYSGFPGEIKSHLD